MRGRKPTPTALKILKGNPGRRPLNGNEPKPKKGAPSCPTWLNAEAKREWRRIVPELERLGLLTLVDRAALAAYCQSYARWQQAEKVIEKQGMTMATPQGFEVARPEVAIARQQMQLVHKFATEFGLSPSSRSRVNAKPGGAGGDPVKDFLFGPKRA